MSETRAPFWRNYRFSLILLASITIGSIIGYVMGKDAVVLQPFAQVFLNLLFTIVVPLVFVTIASSVSSMLDMRRLGKIMGTMFVTFLVLSTIAALLALAAFTIFPPAEGFNLPLPEASNLGQTKIGDAIVKAFTVSDFNEILSRRNMLPLIFFSILIGICASSTCGKDSLVSRLLNELSKILMKAVSIIMLYAPIGLGAYFASLVGEFGPELLGAYAKAMAVYYPLCLIFFVTVLPLYAWYAGGREGVRRFWRHILPPTATSLGTQSSFASLPSNLEAAKNIGIPKDIRDVAMPVSTAIHMDGSVMGAMLKITFLFGMFGADFSGIGLYLVAILVAVAAGLVMSGIPGGGFIAEMLIISLFGFPPEAFAFIAMIAVLIDPPATAINVTTNTTTVMVITRQIEGKDWINKNYEDREAA